MRFHSRNRESWFKKGIPTEEKYRYAYAERELKAWADRIKAVSEPANIVLVIFNNCYQDYAVRNAGMMKGLLGD